MDLSIKDGRMETGIRGGVTVEGEQANCRRGTFHS